MRLLAIGDIHGCFTALTTLWKTVQPSAQDTVVFLGDYVDRGLESHQVLNWLVHEAASPNRIFLRGNHEVMMLNAAENPFQAESWKECGGLETLISYGARTGYDWPSKIPETHWNFIRATVPYYETAKHIFVHACLDPKLDLDEQLEDWLYGKHSTNSGRTSPARKSSAATPPSVLVRSPTLVMAFASKRALLMAAGCPALTFTPANSGNPTSKDKRALANYDPWNYGAPSRRFSNSCVST